MRRWPARWRSGSPRCSEMLRSIFDPQAPFWRGVGKFADVLALSLLWLFLSLPVFTLGAATAALYDATVRCVLGGQNGPLVRFWETFRREFKTASLATLLWGALTALLVWVFYATGNGVLTELSFGPVVSAAFLVLLFLPVGALCWMFPLLSRFTFTTGSLICAALRLAIGFLPRTVVLVASTAAAVYLSDRYLVPMLVLPCLVAMLWSKLLEGVFQRYED